MRRRTLSFAAVAAVAVAAWTIAGRAADKDQDWAAYSGDKAATKYSSLDQIKASNVKGLKIAWRKSAVPDELKAIYPEAQGGTNESFGVNSTSSARHQLPRWICRRRRPGAISWTSAASMD
jgi:hypothetical protein